MNDTITVESQIIFFKDIIELTQGKRSHILFFQSIPREQMECMVKKDLFQEMEFKDGKNFKYQYYITEKFIELTKNLQNE